MSISDYLEQQEIKASAVEVKVIRIKDRQTNKSSVAQIKYKDKVYDWLGEKGQEGKTYSALYSPSKDKFFNEKSKWKTILLGGFFIVIGIYAIVKALISTYKK